MKDKVVLNHQFVEYIPDQIEEGIIYISIDYATMVHKCCCGCGNEIVTPLSPTDWRLIFNGQTISIEPSIGNWSLPCQSHYWINQNKVIWARKWTQEKIYAGRYSDMRKKARYYKQVSRSKNQDSISFNKRKKHTKSNPSFWQRLINRIFILFTL